jgi:hypothetical protein
LKQRLYAPPEASSSTWRTLWEANRFGADFRVGAIFNMRFFLIDRAMIKITFMIKIVPAVQ